MRLLAAALLLLSAQDAARVALRDGSGLQGRLEGTLRFKTAWGTVDLPAADVDRLDLSPYRESEVADIPRRIDRAIAKLDSPKPDERAAAEAEILQAGPLADEALTAAAQVMHGDALSGRVIALINRVRGAPRPALADSVVGLGASLRGWLVDDSVIVGGKKVPVSTVASFARAPRDRTGDLLVRMTDGSVLGGRFGDGTLQVGTTQIPLRNVRSIVVDEVGVARIEADRTVEGKIAADSIPFEAPFGKVALPVKALGAAMRADWKPADMRAPDAQGFLRWWLVYGNVPMQNGDDFDAGHLDCLDEASVAPAPGEEFFGRTWFAYDSPSDVVSVPAALPKESQNQIVCFGALYIRSEHDWTGTLMTQSDDGVKVWMNGRKIHHNHTHRGVDAAADAVPATLRAGWNRLLVMVDNGWGPCGWRLRFVDEKSQALTALTIALEPPPFFRGR